MAIEYISAALRCKKYHGNTRLLLVVLCDHAADENHSLVKEGRIKKGTSWPSWRTLMKRTGIRSKRALNECFAELRTDKVVKTKRRWKKSSICWVDLAELKKNAWADEPQQDDFEEFNKELPVEEEPKQYPKDTAEVAKGYRNGSQRIHERYPFGHNAVSTGEQESSGKLHRTKKEAKEKEPQNPPTSPRLDEKPVGRGKSTKEATPAQDDKAAVTKAVTAAQLKADQEHIEEYVVDLKASKASIQLTKEVKAVIREGLERVYAVPGGLTYQGKPIPPRQIVKQAIAKLDFGDNDNMPCMLVASNLPAAVRTEISGYVETAKTHKRMQEESVASEARAVVGRAEFLIFEAKMAALKAEKRAWDATHDEGGIDENIDFTPSPANALAYTYWLLSEAQVPGMGIEQKAEAKKELARLRAEMVASPPLVTEAAQVGLISAEAHPPNISPAALPQGQPNQAEAASV